MTDHDKAREKAARLLRKQGSVSSLSSSDRHDRHHNKFETTSTVSYMDEPGHEDQFRPLVRLENTYQMEPHHRFPYSAVKNLMQDALDGYLAEEKYEPELCRQMSKTLSEVIKARIKELMIPRYKIICVVHIGQIGDQSMRISSRCLWDQNNDTYACSEFRNKSLFAVASVYGVYYE
ncbi:dynein light chain Tctex-type 5-B-like [Babylonia areolata]|uniref:dynein light chain Tctex-type 5-B-like n=1 Tax=Babylonia areolata TaxID=304850 RepID=UPI003FD363A2